MTKLITDICRLATRVFFLMLISCFFTVSMFAQNLEHYIFPVLGNNSNSTEMTLSWTIGDLVISTIQGENSIQTQGFQQPNIELEKIENSNDIQSDVTVFPNPTNKNITVEFNKAEGVNNKIRLFNSIGQMIHSYSGDLMTHVIDLARFDEGVYLLLISDTEESSWSAYKILKF